MKIDSRADAGLTTRLRWPAFLLLLTGAALAACDSSSDDDDDSAANDPQPGEQPPPSGLPALADPAVSIDAGQMIGAMRWEDGNTADGGQGSTVAGLDCVASSPTDYHVHTHLSIILNGEQLAVPADVGFVSTASTDCQYPVHAHDGSGLLHLHATAPTDFTLGQFFQIWGQPLEPTNVAGLVNLPAVIYIVDENGVVSEYDGAFADVPLVSKHQITIQVGDEISEIPNYSWTGP